MPETPQGASGLKEALARWSRRKLLAIAVFAGCLAGALTIAISLPSIFQAAATVLVENEQVSESFVRPSVTGAIETRLQTINQEVLSRSRLEALIKRFDLYPDVRRRLSIDEAIVRVRRDIRVELKEVNPVESMPGRGPTIAFVVSFRGRSPDTAAQVANEIASFYLNENPKIRARLATDTARFLKAQLDETRRRLGDEEQRISAFKRRHLGELPEQVSVNLATMERLNAQLALNNQEQMRVLERRAELARQASLGGSLSSAEAEVDPELRLARLRFELAKMQNVYSGKYPDVVRLKAEIVVAEQQLAKSRASTSGESLGPLGEIPITLDAEIAALKAEDQRLRLAIAAYQRRLDVAPELDQEIQEMSRNYAAMKEGYDSMLKRYQDAQVAEEMERRRSGEEFRLLDLAIPPREPWAPNRLRIALFGVLLSFAAAMVAVLLAEHFDTSFHTADDLRAFTKVPILATIPNLAGGSDDVWSRRLFGLAAVVIPLGLALVILVSYRFAHGNEELVWMLSRGAS